MRRIALFGPYHSHNLGDIATQIAATQLLRAACPKDELVGVASDPGDSEATLGLPTFPISGRGPCSNGLEAASLMLRAPLSGADQPDGAARAALRIHRFLRELDVLVISGGGQLDDHWGGPWNHPWSLLLWSALARLSGVRLIFLGVGLDGLRTRLGRWFGVNAMRLAQTRIFRDEGSRQAMQAMGLRGHSEVCPDLAFALDPAPLHRTAPAPEGSRPFSVLSPIAEKTWNRRPSSAHQRYMRSLCEAGMALAARGHAIRVVCSQTEMDRDDARALVGALHAAGVDDAQLHDVLTVGDFIDGVRGAEVVVASRLHGVILSLIAGCPVLAVAHLPKVNAVMESFGLAAHCLTLQQLEKLDITDHVDHLLHERETVRRRVVEGVEQRAQTLRSLVARLTFTHAPPDTPLHTDQVDAPPSH